MEGEDYMSFHVCADELSGLVRTKLSGEHRAGFLGGFNSDN